MSTRISHYEEHTAHKLKTECHSTFLASSFVTLDLYPSTKQIRQSFAVHSIYTWHTDVREHYKIAEQLFLEFFKNNVFNDTCACLQTHVI